MNGLLFKNVKVTLLKKWVQLVATGIIIMLSSFIYTAMSYAVISLERPTMQYLKAHLQEDFSLDMLSVITSSELLELGKEGAIPPGIFTLGDLNKYDRALFDSLIACRIESIRSAYPGLDLEMRELKHLFFQHSGREHRGMLIKDARRINLSFIEKGRMPEKAKEIAVSRIYAEKNNLEIGDMLVIQGFNCVITGYVLLPDYTFPMFDHSFLIDNAKQTLILVTESTFKETRGRDIYRLAGKFADDSPRDLKTKIIDDITFHPELDFITSAVLTENQVRSGAIFDELKGGRVFSLGFSIVIALIAIVIVTLLVHKIIEAQRGQIGVLRSLGYKRNEIAFPLVASITFIALVVLFAGYLAGVALAGPLKDLYLDFYLLPSEPVSQDWFVFLTAIFLPLLVFTSFSTVIIAKMLASKPLDLLNPCREEEVNRLSRLANRVLKNVQPKPRFKYLYILKNTTKFITFFIGIMLSTLLVLMSFMMSGLVERMTTAALEKSSYRYQSYFDLTGGLPEVTGEQEKFLSYPDATFNAATFTAFGIEGDNRMFNLFDPEGENITEKIETGAVVTKSLAIKQNIITGDRLEVNISNRAYPVKVEGVTGDYSADRIYFEIETLSNMISGGEDPGLFSGVFSMQKPPAETYPVIMDKSAIADQARLMKRFMDYAVGILIGVSVLTAVLILFVLTAMTVEDNYYNISLLKVIGYLKREVNSMILDSYLVYAVLSFIISIPVALVFLDWMMDFFIVNYDLVFPLEFRPVHIFIALAILLIVFFAGTWNAKKKIERISLQEILKTYQE